MTIWLIAILLLASLAGLGYRQGAIRVGISFVGIVVGAFLAIPLGRLIRPLLVSFGLKDPVWAWALAPVIVFILVSMTFKAIAMAVHHKVDVYYKYKAGDLRLALWERLNRRVGLCLGLVNASAYLVLISFGIYFFSYWTYQVASSEEDPRSVRILNRLGVDLQKTGFNKVAASLDSMPEVYYEIADLVGLVYHNPLLHARIKSYPPFLSLAERPDFQQLGADKDFPEMHARRVPFAQLLAHPTVHAIFRNPETLKFLYGLVVPDLKDLRAYLENTTQPSAKYGVEPILGRWTFNVNAAMALVRKAKPNISSTDMQKLKRWIVAAFDQTTLVAMPDKKVIVKNALQLTMPAPGAVLPSGPQNVNGEWASLDGGKYYLSFPDANLPNLAGVIEGDKLTITGPNVSLVFNKYD